ncbi:MAG: hypothetical protein JXA21_23125 [Anaerolineae bacterium]|nr:hypothetical protein [Anaerolineae bacterium]
MENMTTGLIVAGVIIVGVLLLVGWLYLRSRRIDLTRDGASSTEKPRWMSTTPPPETITVTQASHGHAEMYGQEEGERLASPFAEQIEDILRIRLQNDATLANVRVDLGSAADGSLEIWVDGECYHNIDEVPNPRIQEAFKDAVKRWEQTQSR